MTNEAIIECIIDALNMVNSPAFKKLTNAARVAYLLLKCQCKESGQHEVIFPYIERGFRN